MQKRNELKEKTNSKEQKRRVLYANYHSQIETFCKRKRDTNSEAKTATALTKNIHKQQQKQDRIRIRITIYQSYRRHQRQWDIISMLLASRSHSVHFWWACLCVPFRSFMGKFSFIQTNKQTNKRYEEKKKMFRFVSFFVLCVTEWVNCTRMSNNKLAAWAMIIALQAQPTTKYIGHA